MLENILIHFVFIFFVFWAFVWWLGTKRKFDIYKNVLFPAVILKNFHFPQHRSLLVRCCAYLEEELTQLFCAPVKIKLNLELLPSDRNFILPLCPFLAQQDAKFENEKSFLYEGQLYAAKELQSLFLNLKEKIKILFSFNIEKNLWQIEVIHV